MKKTTGKIACRPEQPAEVGAQDVLPARITKEDIAETIAIWQPYNKERLTEADAVEMLMNVRRLAEVFCWARQHQECVERLPEMARTLAA